MVRTGARGDGLVVFGITGDLAFKHILPALQRMVQAGELNVPVVGVAREHWTVEKLDERLRNSLLASAEGLDGKAYEKLCGLVRYAWGTYDDPRTYVALRDALGGATARSTISQSRLSSSRRSSTSSATWDLRSVGASSSRSRLGAIWSRPGR